MFSSSPHVSVLTGLGWDDSWEQLAPTGDASGTPGRVARVDRGRVDVLTDAGRVRATPLGVCAVGDWVLVDGPSVVAVLPRRTALTRASASGRSEGQVLAANVDTVLVTVALGSALRAGRTERLLALAWESGATPVVVLTKIDRDDGTSLVAALTDLAAAAPGVDVVPVSAVTGDGLAEVAAAARGTTVLVGPSGAGKSTLANALLGEDVLAVGAVRDVDDKGRHTTVHRELLLLPGRGRTQRSGAAAPEAHHSVLIDTPGLRAVGVRDAAGGIDRAFADVVDLAERCRFADCAHDREPGCAVRSAVDAGELSARRREGYRTLQREDEWAAARTTPGWRPSVAGDGSRSPTTSAYRVRGR
ncbi:putative ribosome biogenesis GTPase RsgA [Actinomycetospora sp. NBRC 106375]|uniref:ribosome small subunit-dependent GTPase A n=1 Tax=Actinomycetospora sp. NBRC 106375 TaxID=3032207 RepID=UPI0024A3444C|nr:ribosome small subunit-dependent GTPase A [Actinomycetospora sp. NBRC 106375]GLZ46718.1 putative ribosome biogenesis GTPase RsgA [Actinomycetospora sp. NBRC 106375]